MRQFLAAVLTLCVAHVAVSSELDPRARAHPADAAAPPAGAALATPTGTPAATPLAIARLAAHVRAARDAEERPFAIVDKAAATMAVYHGDGSLAAVTPVLLGRTRGDQVPPGVGARTQSGSLRAADQVTPAGRFVAQPGRNRQGEAVVWVDHGSAFAIHRLRTGAGEALRTQRLASGRADERRVSAGCVVVPVAFYQQVVQPLLGTGPSVVYVMPEAGPGALLRGLLTSSSGRDGVVDAAAVRS